MLGSAQLAPRLSRALVELGVGAEVFAALPTATRDLFGLPVGIKAAAGAYIHALQLERANSLLASIDGNFHAGVPDLGGGSRCACSARSTDAAAAREGPP